MCDLGKLVRSSKACDTHQIQEVLSLMRVVLSHFSRVRLFATLWTAACQALSLCIWASMMAQQVKNSPAMQETQEMQVGSLGWDASLEEEMETH